MKLVESTPAQVAICVPCGDSVKTETFESMTTMCTNLYSNPPPDFKSAWLQTFRGSLLPDSRNFLALQALERGATHILWVDSDMQFPPDTLHRLLAHRKGIVGINASMRRPPYLMTAESKPYEKLVTTKDSTGLEKVHRMGFGVVLIEANVFRKIKKRPYFAFEWVGSARDGAGCHRGEDYYFYQKARRAGYELFVDQDLSKQVGHVGSFSFYPNTGGKA